MAMTSTITPMTPKTIGHLYLLAAPSPNRPVRKEAEEAVPLLSAAAVGDELAPAATGVDRAPELGVDAASAPVLMAISVAVLPAPAPPPEVPADAAAEPEACPAPTPALWPLLVEATAASVELDLTWPVSVDALRQT